MPLIRKSPDAPSHSEEQDKADVLATLARGTSDQRWSAARVAAEAPGGIAALGQALSAEADLRVREAMFTSLAAARCSESVLAVLPHLRSDDAHLRTGALDALRAMPEAAAPYLSNLLGDPDPDVRLLACEVVRDLPTEAGTALLCELLEKEQAVNVCAAALDVLAERGGPEAVPVLMRCAQRFQDDPFVSFSIKVAAVRLGAGLADPRG